ncbi:hypothetical protein G7Z17_g1153 [Cylindrodendrum hubeiense]|uniref:Major facilitator superfamily (MFS) profile domain-containing protein n=1 Tax=Cylindrodendrum hubeiense TaxID=595255 RepID=A0A9P5HFG6_9HYPO|nr:hypothetical protein G7Z17_g1153 [Cylindrodendrum hubeiense]
MTEAHASDGQENPAGDNPAPWYKQSHLLKLNYIILSLVLFSSANGYDGSIMGGLLAFDTWNQFMENPTGLYLGWISAIYWLGNGLFFPVAAWVSNRYGRKPGIYVGYLFLVIGTAMQATAQSEKIFTVARLFIGTAGAWFGNSAPLLINEIAHPKHRSIASALFMCGWPLGGTVCSWVVFACRTIPSNWSWRVPVIMQIVIPLIGLPGFLMAPESPRWLISVGRTEEATEIIANHQAGGDRQSPLVTHQVQEIEEIITIEKEAAANTSGSFAESGSSKVGLAVVPFLFIFYGGYDIALTPFYTSYPCEIWPFRLRSFGLSLTWCSSVLALFFNTFINPIALKAIAWKFYIVFVVVLLLLLVTVYFYYPETRGYSLEQIATVFDGIDGVQTSGVMMVKTEDTKNGKPVARVDSV